MPKIKAGELRHYILLQRPQRGPRDSAGKPRVYWQNAGFVYAAIRQLAGGEGEDAGQTLATRRHEIEIRHRPDVNQTWRAVFGLRVFNFESVDNDRELDVRAVITATEDAQPRELLLFAAAGYLTYGTGDGIVFGG
jgi:SPP1 family predicted phage head-tail adaptor